MPAIRGFYGVFDGHGGHNAANFVEAYIYDAFVRQCLAASLPLPSGSAAHALELWLYLELWCFGGPRHATLTAVLRALTFS